MTCEKQLHLPEFRDSCIIQIRCLPPDVGRDYNQKTVSSMPAA